MNIFGKLLLATIYSNVSTVILLHVWSMTCLRLHSFNVKNKFLSGYIQKA